MKIEIFECEEFSPLPLRINNILDNGELKLDERVVGRGYLNVSLRGSEIIFRSDRHIGLIPITKNCAIRVRPRASISNLSYMIARSGIAPIAIPAFSRGYLPKFEISEDIEKVYGESLLLGTENVFKRGLMKRYVPVANPPLWRGRFLASETVRKHISRGVKFRHEFEYKELTQNVIENIAMKEALIFFKHRMEKRNRNDPSVKRATIALNQFSSVSEWSGTQGELVKELGRQISKTPPQLAYYRDPLWVAFLMLQSSLPDIEGDGAVPLDSLIVDVSKVFEGYLRRAIADRAAKCSWKVVDGNHKPSPFFVEHKRYTVQPDIVITENGRPIAALDAKYKLNPKENDRYELLAFMEALGVQAGGFICPARDNTASSIIGTTPSGKQMSNLRFDLAAKDPETEADRLFSNIEKLVRGEHDFD